MSVNYIGYIERGKQAPYLKTLERIAEAIGVEVYELFLFKKEERNISDEDSAIKDLLLTLHNRPPKEIRFIASILKQIFERR